MYKVPEKILTNEINEFSEIPYDVYFHAPDRYLTKKIYNNVRMMIENNQNYNFYFISTLDEIFNTINERGGYYISNKIFIPNKFIHEEFFYEVDNSILVLCCKPFNITKLKYKKIQCIIFETGTKVNMTEDMKRTFSIQRHYEKKFTNDNKRIPKKIFQTNKTNICCKHEYETLQRTLEVNPDYDYYFFDDEACKKFISFHFGERHLKCFNSVIPGAFKADYFRYMLLFIEGGIYIDFDTKVFLPFDDLIDNDTDFIVPRDKDWFGYQGLYNTFIGSIPGHYILKTVIELVTQNIEKRMTGPWLLSITGPTALFNAYYYHHRDNAPIGKRNNIEILWYKFLGPGNGFLIKNDKKYFTAKRKCDAFDSLNYVLKYLKRDLYKD